MASGNIKKIMLRAPKYWEIIVIFGLLIFLVTDCGKEKRMKKMMDSNLRKNQAYHQSQIDSLKGEIEKDRKYIAEQESLRLKEQAHLMDFVSKYDKKKDVIDSLQIIQMQHSSNYKYWIEKINE